MAADTDIVPVTFRTEFRVKRWLEVLAAFDGLSLSDFLDGLARTEIESLDDDTMQDLVAFDKKRSTRKRRKGKDRSTASEKAA